MNEPETGAERVPGRSARTIMSLGGAIRAASLVAIGTSLWLIARRLPLGALAGALEGWALGLGTWGPAAYAVVYIIAVVALVPASMLTIAAGAIFGPVVGTIVVSIASTTGAALAFLIARYLAREAVARRASRCPRFEAVDRAIGAGGWRVVALLRLSPAVPFNLQNYLYGLTSIPFCPCVLTSWVAMLPGTVVYVYLGHAGRASLEAAAGGRMRTPAEWAMLGVGLAATVAVTLYITRLARAAMKARTAIGARPAVDGSPASDFARGGPWGTAVLSAIALLALALAGHLQWRPDAIEGLLARMAGPPRVVLREAYANDRSGPRFDHAALDGLLKAHVTDGGWVDYPGLGRDVARLDAYLARIADAPFDAMGRDEKLALLINAYNACTLKLVLEHVPIDSILSIPAAERWNAVRWRIGAHIWSLNQIEHEQVRPKFREPRVHFALVCAAIGCPPLRAEAFSADRLDEQLEDQARYVHEHDRWLRFKPGGAAVWLTRLYEWYGNDFEQVGGSVPAFAARFAPVLKASLDAGRTPAVRWLEYDWSLNSRENHR